jgi:hypothetical protein
MQQDDTGTNSPARSQFTALGIIAAVLVLFGGSPGAAFLIAVFVMALRTLV